MKKIIFPAIAVAIALVGLAACGHPQEPAGEASPQNWRGQLQYLKTHYGKKAVLKNDPASNLYFEDYTYKGRIEDEKDLEEVKEELCGDDAYTLSPFKPAPDMPFAISTIGEIRELCARQDIPMKLDSVRIWLNCVLHPGMEVFKLEWNCNGRTFTSTAVAEKDSGFVYETIGWYLMDQKDRNDDENPTSRITDGEYEILTTHLSNENGGPRNAFGIQCLSYDIVCASRFSKDGILRGRQMQANFQTIMGWNGTIAVRPLEGEPDKDHYDVFAYGYGCSPWYAESRLTDEDNGYTLSGQYGATGSKTHSIELPQ